MFTFPFFLAKTLPKNPQTGRISSKDPASVGYMDDGQNGGKCKATKMNAYMFVATPRRQVLDNVFGMSEGWISNTADKDCPQMLHKRFRHAEGNIVEDRTMRVARSMLSTRYMYRATPSARVGRRYSL